MGATEDAIADAVALEINQGGFALPNPAQRAYDNTFQEADLKSLRVVVIPLSLDTTGLDRSGDCSMDYGVTIDIQQAFQQPVPLASVEALNALAEAVHDKFRKPHALSGTAYTVSPTPEHTAKRPEIFIPERLWDQGTYETYIELTVRAYR